MRTTAKAVDKGLAWPCPGEILYLDGKAYGIVIKSKLGEAEKAVASGTVSSAGPYRGYGNVVFVLFEAISMFMEAMKPYRSEPGTA